MDLVTRYRALVEDLLAYDFADGRYTAMADDFTRLSPAILAIANAIEPSKPWALILTMQPGASKFKKYDTARRGALELLGIIETRSCSGGSYPQDVVRSQPTPISALLVARSIWVPIVLATTAAFRAEMVGASLAAC